MHTCWESFPDAGYDAFIGRVTSFGMSAPGNYSNLQNARIVDAAIDIMDRGGTLTDAQLAKAITAMQNLTSSWGDPDKSKWSGNALQQWTDAGNAYADRSALQTAGLNGDAVNSGQNIPENFIPLPMFNNAAQNDLSVQKNFIPLPMFNATEQGNPTNASEASSQANAPATADSNSVPSNFIPLPMFNGTEQSSQTNASETSLQASPAAAAEQRVVLPPAANNTAAAESDAAGQKDFASSPTANSATVEQNGQTVQEKSSQAVDRENTNHQISDQTHLEEQQEKTFLDVPPKELDGADTSKLSWKERMSVTDGKTVLQSNDGERAYEIPSLKEVPVSKKQNGVITLLRSIAQTINPRDYRDYIKAFADKNLVTKFDSEGKIIDAKPVQIKSDGTIVLISQKGINDFSKKIRGKGQKSIDNVASIMVLDKLIEEGSEVDWSENKKGRVNPYTYYQSKLNIEGREYNVKIHIKNTPINNFYYYHALNKIEITPPNGTLTVEHGRLDLK